MNSFAMKLGSLKTPSIGSFVRPAIVHAIAIRAPTDTAAVLRVSHECAILFSFPRGLMRRISRRMFRLRDSGASAGGGILPPRAVCLRAASNRRSISSGSGFMVFIKPEVTGGYFCAFEFETPRTLSSVRSLLLARKARTLIRVVFHPVMAEISAIDFSSMCRS